MNPADALSIQVGGGASTAVQLFLLLSVMSFLPGMIIAVTSFTRIIIVLSFVRQAIGAPQLPPNPVLLGLSMFLTLFIMGPVLDEVHTRAIKPLFDGQIAAEVALHEASGPLKIFMLKQTREEDLILFHQMSGMAAPTSVEDVPLRVVVPAFMVSELTTAFTIGVHIFVPLLLVDILVSAILMALGMMMVPPSMISLPVKIAVFVLADGWHLIVGRLAESFVM